MTDHIIPHRGDKRLFWDRSNWQPMCDRCHNIKRATEDKRIGGEETYPLAPTRR